MQIKSAGTEWFLNDHTHTEIKTYGWRLITFQVLRQKAYRWFWKVKCNIQKFSVRGLKLYDESLREAQKVELCWRSPSQTGLLRVRAFDVEPIRPLPGLACPIRVDITSLLPSLFSLIRLSPAVSHPNALGCKIMDQCWNLVEPCCYMLHFLWFSCFLRCGGKEESPGVQWRYKALLSLHFI